MGLVPGQGGWYTEPEWQGDPWPDESTQSDNTDSSTNETTESLTTTYIRPPISVTAYQNNIGFETYFWVNLVWFFVWLAISMNVQAIRVGFCNGYVVGI